MAGCLPAIHPSIYPSIRASGRPRAAAALRSPRHLRAHTAPVRAPAGNARPRRARGTRGVVRAVPALGCAGSALPRLGAVSAPPPPLLPPLLPAQRPPPAAAPAQAALGKGTGRCFSPEGKYSPGSCSQQSCRPWLCLRSPCPHPSPQAGALNCPISSHLSLPPLPFFSS